ncbi:restriction endonuclease subunit S [Sulfuricystis multivorans]|uniref:restriction endonuclease subunit S n=1 Tax=Sulfuricystis multivorans TaxID=2211108 RepID=UPI000F818AA2|nr:restriction endonuclease subunit S [Sulfuricystis multivorans]
MGGEWVTASLGELCDFRAGTVFKPAFQGKSSGEFPFVKVSDMNLPSNTIRIQDANNWVSAPDLKELRAKPFPPGTVVFAKIGEALRQNRLRQVGREILIDNNMMGAIPRVERVDARYFYYALSQFDFAEIAQGTALPYLTVASLAALEFVVPPLPEQRAIAHILGTLDDKIENLRRQNETLEAMARALFKAWFVDFEPVRAKCRGDLHGRPRWQRGESLPGLPAHLYDLFPDRLVDSELGEIPEGWEVGTLGDVLVQRVDRCSPSVETRSRPYVPIECIAARSLLLADCRPGEEAQSSLTKFRRGDLLFGAMRPYFHKVAIAPFDGTTRTTVFVLQPREADDFSFVALLIHDAKTIEYATNHSTGSTIPYAVWQGSLESMPVVLPPAPVRKSFDQIARPLLDRIPPVFFANHTLAALRDALLPKLISGELRVKDVDRFIEKVAS